jgi:hypothetical protein
MTTEGHYTRESSDKPRLNAFCRVAPSVRFNARAMRDASVFFFASVFNVRICAVVHGRRFNILAIQITFHLEEACL